MLELTLFYLAVLAVLAPLGGLLWLAWRYSAWTRTNAHRPSERLREADLWYRAKELR